MKSGDVTFRNTEAISAADVAPAVRAAILEYLTDKVGIDGVLESVTRTWRTVSSTPGGFLRRGRDTVQLLLLGPTWLLVVAYDAAQPPTWANVMAIRLADVRVQDYETSSLARLRPDRGLILTWQAEGPDPSSTFLALGAEPAGEDLRRRLHAATLAR